MIAAGVSDELVVGLVLGFALGFLTRPVIGSWMSWRESTRASREADLLDSVVARMDPAAPSDGTTPLGAGGGPISQEPAEDASGRDHADIPRGRADPGGVARGRADASEVPGARLP